MGQLREVSNKTHTAELKLFLEIELGLVMSILLNLLLTDWPLNMTAILCTC